jgi:hypothetical protein
VKLRPIILALGAAALISGCGSSTDTVNVDDTTLDTTAPGAPSGVGATFDARRQRTLLIWEASAAADVAGYQIYHYDPDPLRESAYALYGETDDTRIWLPYAPTNTTRYVRIRAIDASGNVGAFTTITPVVLRGSHFDEP